MIPETQIELFYRIVTDLRKKLTWPKLRQIAADIMRLQNLWTQQNEIFYWYPQSSLDIHSELLQLILQRRRTIVYKMAYNDYVFFLLFSD